MSCPHSSSPASLPSFPFLPLPSYEVCPLNPARESGEALLRSFSEVWGRIPAQIEFGALQLKNMTSDGSNFNDFLWSLNYMYLYSHRITKNNRLTHSGEMPRVGGD